MSVNEVKNKQAPFELEIRGTGHPGSRTYAIGNEDHTLGNSLRHVLMQNPKVSFAGYSVPHPSEPIVHLRVQTVPGEKGRKASTAEQTNAQDMKMDTDEMDTDEMNNDDEYGNENINRPHATDVLREACETLSAQCQIVYDKLEEMMPDLRADRLQMEEYERNNQYAGEMEEEEQEFGLEEDENGYMEGDLDEE